jgi:hypothetical protein
LWCCLWTLCIRFVFLERHDQIHPKQEHRCNTILIHNTPDAAMAKYPIKFCLTKHPWQSCYFMPPRLTLSNFAQHTAFTINIPQDRRLTMPSGLMLTRTRFILLQGIIEIFDVLFNKWHWFR